MRIAVEDQSIAHHSAVHLKGDTSVGRSRCRRVRRIIKPPPHLQNMASDLIGKGEFATVRLENSPDGSSVAVKVYEHRVGSPGSDLQRMHEMHLANEVRLAGRLAHPHIIAPQEVRVGGSRTELTMEYAPHGTLARASRQSDAAPSPPIDAPT